MVNRFAKVTETSFVLGGSMDQRFNLEAWQALLAVEDAGALTAAAAKLDAEPSTVSRLIAGLEKTLGRELVHRNERPITITEDGRRAAQGMRPILKAHAAFLAKFANDTSAMSGTIRLSVAGGLLHDKLMPILADFQALYPDINFDITSGREVAECLAGAIDIASVSSVVTESGVMCLPRGRSVFLPVASPAYLARNGVPLRPEDLINHTGFVYTGPVRPATERLELRGQTRPVRFKSSIHSTDILMIKQAVLDGRGVAVDLPLLHCANEIAAGRLKVILGGWHRPSIPAFAACSAAGWHIRRIRVFMQWWCDRFQKEFESTEKVLRAVLGEEASLYTETVAADGQESR